MLVTNSLAASFTLLQWHFIIITKFSCYLTIQIIIYLYSTQYALWPLRFALYVRAHPITTILRFYVPIGNRISTLAKGADYRFLVLRIFSLCFKVVPPFPISQFR